LVGARRGTVGIHDCCHEIDKDREQKFSHGWNYRQYENRIRRGGRQILN